MMRIDKLIEEIEEEIQEFEQYQKIENSPLGGNIVKAALYGGHAAGLKSALNRIRFQVCQDCEYLGRCENDPQRADYCPLRA